MPLSLLVEVITFIDGTKELQCMQQEDLGVDVAFKCLCSGVKYKLSTRLNRKVVDLKKFFKFFLK